MAFLEAALLLSVAGALFYLGVVATAAVVLALKTGGRRDDVPDERTTRSVSRFTIPVSIVIPAGSALTEVDATLVALSQLNYPELELIVVVSGAADATLNPLRSTWQLEAKEFFYRQSIQTATVHRIYRSARDPRVIVVDKTEGSRTDAMNCGVNIARLRYVAIVDPGIAMDADALLRLMAAPLRDPGAVVGASNHVERLGLFERLGTVRALMASRLLWRHLGCGFGTQEQVSVWRRDVLLGANGFAPTAFVPELDMARRAVGAARAEGAPARFHRGADIFGTTAPRSLTSIVRHATGWRLAALQNLRVLCPSGFRTFGLDTVACFVLSELLTPLAQLWVMGASGAALATGAISWITFAAALALLAFGHGAVTTAALLMRGVSPEGPAEPLLVRLVGAAPLEILCYRPMLAVALLLGFR